MGFAQQLEKLSSQPMEEQNLLVKSYNDFKQHLYTKRVDKFMKEVNKHGPSKLDESPYQNDSEVIIKSIKNEHIFRADKFTVENFESDFKRPFFDERGTDEAKEWLAKYHVDDGIYERLKSYDSERKSSSVLLYASDEITDTNLHIGRLAVDLVDGEESKYMGPKLLDDREIGLKSLNNYWYISCVTLDRFSERLKDDKEFVIRFVEHEGTNLQFASDRLKDDIDVARASYHCWNDDGIPFISDRLKNDMKFGAEIAGDDGYKLQYFGDQIKDDIHIVKRALSSADSLVILDASPRLQAIAGMGNPTDNLEKAIEREKFFNTLDKKLLQKVEAPTKRIKI